MMTPGRRRMLASALALPLGATQAAIGSAAPFTLPGTRTFDVNREGLPRRLFVAPPGGAAPEGGWPVLWVLDGNALFPLFAALLRVADARPGDLRTPLPLVVGLGHAGDAAYDPAARAADYTLPERGGQADRFLDALTSQWRPLLASHWPLHPARQTLFGHSFGGLLTLYALFARPGLFERHVAASPSIWWGDRAILRHRDAFLRHAAERPLRLTVTAGSLEEDAAAADTERLQRQQARKQISSAREIVQGLDRAPGVEATFRLFDGEDHGGVVLPSARLALAEATSGGRHP
jgi:predicted alpha/beta superfamily hydrolase